MPIDRAGKAFTATCDGCKKSQAWGDLEGAGELEQGDDLRRQLHGLGWDDRASRSGSRVTWTWFCPACRVTGNPKATGPSVGAGVEKSPMLATVDEIAKSAGRLGHYARSFGVPLELVLSCVRLGYELSGDEAERKKVPFDG